MATSSAGNAATIIRHVTSIDQVKTGIRSSVIPGARRRMIVARMQAAEQRRRRSRRASTPDDPQVHRRRRACSVASDSGYVGGPARVAGAVAREEARATSTSAAERRAATSRAAPGAGTAISRGADLQRHEVDPQRQRDRHDEEVDHRRAVHREELVVAVARDDLQPRLGELGAHEQREHAAGQEEPEGRGHADAHRDALVVGPGDQPDDARARGANGGVTVALSPPARCAGPPREVAPDMASTVKTIWACLSPQYSAQCRPGGGARRGTQDERGRCRGKASRLKRT